MTQQCTESLKCVSALQATGDKTLENFQQTDAGNVFLHSFFKAVINDGIRKLDGLRDTEAHRGLGTVRNEKFKW